MIKAVFFDVDGTLINSDELVYGALEHILETNGFAKVDRDRMSKLMGKELHHIFAEIASGGNVVDLSTKLIEYQISNTQLAVAYPDSVTTLDTIKKSKKHIAAITSRSNQTVAKTLHVTNLANLIDLTLTVEDVTNPKPHPEGLLKALSHFGLHSSEAVMVGDTSSDIRAGKAAGIKTIGVTYGMLGKEITKSNPDHVVDTLAEILEIIG